VILIPEIPIPRQYRRAHQIQPAQRAQLALIVVSVAFKTVMRN
jgi:hypothetical protein